MSDETTVPPALSEEEWKRAAVDEICRGDLVLSQDGAGVYVSDVSPDGGSLWIDDRSRHALAALALYGQPFGFTHEELTALAVGDVVMACPYTGEEMERFKELRVRLYDKIAALLPPED